MYLFSIFPTFNFFFFEIIFSGKKILKISSSILFLSFFSTTVYASAGESADSQIMDFIWKTVNFLILVAIIYKFAKKPVANALSSRAKYAKQLIDEAREAEEKVSTNLIEMKTKIADLEKEALEMVETAKIEAEAEKTRIIEEGKKEIQRMTEQANFTIQQEQRKVEDELKNWVAEESVKLAKKKLKEKMNQKNQKNLVINYLNQLKKHKELL